MSRKTTPNVTQDYFSDPQIGKYNYLKELLRKGEKDMVKSCIEKGFPLNNDYVDSSYDGTPLHLAVSLQYPDIVELLLEKGAYVNSRNNDNETPLMLAAIIGNSQVTDIFFRKLAPYNFSNDHCFSHFHIACMQNKMELVQEFLINGADINKSVSERSYFWPGFTPLHFAVEFKSIETAKFLIDNRADITIQDSRGLTPLHLAFRKRDRLLTDLLLSKQYYWASNPANPDGLSHFHIACAFNKKEIVEDFLDKKINLRNNLPRLLNRHDHNGFKFAIRNQCIDVLKCLLKCDASAVERNGYFIIDYAYETKNENILNLVISSLEKDVVSSHSQPVNTNLIGEEILPLDESNNQQFVHKQLKTFDVSLYSELHVAVLQKNKDQINSLLDLNRGSIILEKDAQRKTPLHLAFETDQNLLVDRLLSLHLELYENPVDGNNLSHFHISCTTNNKSIVEDFIEKGVDVNMTVNTDSPVWAGCTPLHVAVMYRQIKVMKSLLDNGADFTLKNAQDLSPYDLAIPGTYPELIVGHDEDDYGDWDAVEQILLANEHRKVDNFDDRGITLLHIASVTCNTAMIRTYASSDTINKTTDENLPHSSGFTPLHFSASAEFDETSKVENAVKLLLDLGADPAIQNCEKCLAGHYFKCNDNRLYLVPKNCYNNTGISIFHKACQCANIEVIEHFLNMEADVVNIPVPHTCEEHTENGDEGKAPLHLAVGADKADIVRLLLKRGADVNGRDCYYNTPLHFWRSREVLEILLSHGADPEALNCELLTALEWTLTYSCQPDFVTAIIENGWDINTTKLELSEMLTASNSVVFARHIERLRVLGLVVNERNLQLYDSILRNFLSIRNDAHGYEAKCTKEINLMRGIEVDSNTTMYTLLLKSSSKMAKYRNNEIFCRIVESRDLRQKYPIYSYLINLQFKKSQKRADLLEQGKQSLGKLTNQWLGDLVFELILQFLNDHEITYLNYAAKDQNIFQSFLQQNQLKK